MSTWTFEPGHTEVRFRARHMMVTCVEGLLKGVRGRASWEPGHLREASFEATIDTGNLWTGEEARDEHLKGPDFFDAERHPVAAFRSERVSQQSETEFLLDGELTIRGVARPVTLRCTYVGGWSTPYWESKGEEWRDLGPVHRVGFTATTTVNRHDWGVSWQDQLDGGGVVVGDEVELRIDVEALRDEDVARAEREAEAWKRA